MCKFHQCLNTVLYRIFQFSSFHKITWTLSTYKNSQWLTFSRNLRNRTTCSLSSVLSQWMVVQNSQAFHSFYCPTITKHFPGSISIKLIYIIEKKWLKDCLPFPTTTTPSSSQDKNFNRLAYYYVRNNDILWEIIQIYT